MQFTKPMIELVYEIRRRVPGDVKPGIKLANPELFDELKTLYFDKANAVTKALIKELFHLAGPTWMDLLEKKNSAIPKQRVKVYRGQTEFEDSKLAPQITEERRKQIKKKIYRGQVVLD